MRTRGKVTTTILLLVVLCLGLWQLTSPASLSAVGTKYVSTGPFSNKGSWVCLETSGYGRVFLGFSIANLTFPRSSLSTSYSVVVSKVNETVTGSYVRSFSLRITGLEVEDNYDGTVSNWGKTSDIGDAVQATTIFLFKTTADHQLRFTINYQLYDLMLFGYLPDHSSVRSFNITQTIL